MSVSTGDSLSTPGAGVSRRASFFTLGGALAVAAAKREVRAAKGGKLGRQKVRQTCQRLAAQCRAAVTSVCAEAADPGRCAQEFVSCCDPLADCNGDAAVRCLFVLI